jgi:hypothetical protein
VSWDGSEASNPLGVVALDGDPTALLPQPALVVPNRKQGVRPSRDQGAMPIYGPAPQIWRASTSWIHGLIVRILEQQFAER